MPRYLIEIPHEPNMKACVQAVEVFHQTGSHYLTHADWGCLDGDHRSWAIVEVDTKNEARMIVPTPYRSTAHVIQLNGFTVEQVHELMKSHEP